MRRINDRRIDGPEQLSPESRALRTAWRLAFIESAAEPTAPADPHIIDLREYIRRRTMQKAG